MSSNIKVQRICQYCGKDFEARTTVTKTCSDNCAKRLYKQKQKALKVQASNDETSAIRLKPLEQIAEKPFLTVAEVSELLSCTKLTIYRLIERGTIKSINLGKRKTLIKRSDIDKLFE